MRLSRTLRYAEKAMQGTEDEKNITTDDPRPVKPGRLPKSRPGEESQKTSTEIVSKIQSNSSNTKFIKIRNTVKYSQKNTNDHQPAYV